MGGAVGADGSYPGDRLGHVFHSHDRSAPRRGRLARPAGLARVRPVPADGLVGAAGAARNRHRHDHRRAGALARESDLPAQDAAARFRDRGDVAAVQESADRDRLPVALDRHRVLRPLDSVLLMELDTLLRSLEATGFATAIREHESLFPWLESLHVLAITLVVGSIAIVDLRLMGLASLERAAARLTSDVLPCTWAAFAGAVITGGLLFSSNAFNYAHNSYFLAEFV